MALPRRAGSDLFKFYFMSIDKKNVFNFCTTRRILVESEILVVESVIYDGSKKSLIAEIACFVWRHLH